MSKAPAFQFYPERFIMGCGFMSTSEVGCYIIMLCHQWSHGALPNDAIALQRLCKSDAPITALVMSKFEVGEDGMLRNAALEKTREDQDAYRSRITGVRSAAAKKRWDDANASANAMQLQSTSNAFKEVGDRVLSQERKERAKLDERFEALWSAYGKIGSKPQAFTYWRSLSEVDKMAVEAKLPAYVASTPGGQFRKHLQGWINPKGRLWESALVTAREPVIDNKPKGVWNML